MTTGAERLSDDTDTEYDDWELPRIRPEPHARLSCVSPERMTVLLTAEADTTRLRTLLAALPKHGPVVAFGDLVEWCMWCDERAPDDRTSVQHAPGCPWLSIQAELAGRGGAEA